MTAYDIEGEVGGVWYEGEAYSPLAVYPPKDLINLKGRNMFVGVPVPYLDLHQDLIGIFNKLEEFCRHCGDLFIGHLIAQAELFLDLPVVGHDGIEIDGELLRLLNALG